MAESWELKADRLFLLQLKLDTFMIDRRKFLHNMSVLLAGSSSLASFFACRKASQTLASVPGNLRIPSQSPSKHVPYNFSGFSYELAQLMDAKFFSAANTELIKLFKIPSPKGVLRLGGNSSESCWLKVDPTTICSISRLAMNPISIRNPTTGRAHPVGVSKTIWRNGPHVPRRFPILYPAQSSEVLML